MKRCHKCGEEWTRPGPPGFKETCPKCTSYLHACVNCKLYNPTADRCSSVTAECTGDREGLNYCEEFQFRDQPNNANRRSGTGRAPSRSRISSSTRAKSAPTRSILFTRHTRGTR